MRRIKSSRSRTPRVCFCSTWPANTVQRRASFGWCMSTRKRLKSRPPMRFFAAVSASSPSSLLKSRKAMRCLRSIIFLLQRKLLDQRGEERLFFTHHFGEIALRAEHRFAAERLHGLAHPFVGRGRHDAFFDARDR